jgi:PAP2 superfamily
MLAAAAVLSTLVLSAPARADDTITKWNELASEALTSRGQGAVALAHLAMMNGAAFDAVNAIDGRYEPYLVAPRARRWYSQDAAAVTAAYRVLVDSQPPVVLPEQLAGLVAVLKPQYDASLAAIPDGPAKDGGVAVGEAAARAMIAARLDDGRFGPFRFSVGTLPGQWRPVLPLFVNDPGAWLKDVRPFLIESSSQFGGPGPYELTSRKYAKELDEVKLLGAAGSTLRTTDQTDAAQFWGNTNAVRTWGRLYANIATTYGCSLADNTRMFATVYLAAADAAITVWTDKAKYSFWRPITAIREADSDGNPRTVADPGWLPLVNTPPYTDHPSGLSSLAGASAEALRGFFGTDDLAFGATNALGATRNYTRFSQAAEEIVDARVWSGIHFRHSDRVGAAIGERVARWQQHRFPRWARDHDHHGHDR